jgi:four helix bundle protein
MADAFTDLRVWQSAMDLAIEVYRETSQFPRDEIYSLTQQVRRAAVSVPSNIAEGKGRKSRKKFQQFLFHAGGSLLELQTQIMIAGRLNYLAEHKSKVILDHAAQIGRSLTGLINSLSDNTA